MILGGLIIIFAAMINLHAEPSPAAPPDGNIAAAPDEPAEAAAEAPAPEAAAAPEPSRAAIERIFVPRAGIDANVVVLGVKPDGEMQSPSTPTDVAWYHFTGYPGFGSNSVFAGHVDFANYGKAVFWHLRDLKEGDEVSVRLTDGTTYAYRVTSMHSFSSAEAPVQDIIGPTDRESITLITCDGTFNTRTRHYDKRLVVRAERVLG